MVTNGSCVFSLCVCLVPAPVGIFYLGLPGLLVFVEMGLKSMSVACRAQLPIGLAVQRAG
jgi:hypothetical protein